MYLYSVSNFGHNIYFMCVLYLFLLWQQDVPVVVRPLFPMMISF